MKTLRFVSMIIAAAAVMGCSSWGVRMSPEGTARLAGVVAADVAVHAADLNAADLELARPVIVAAKEALEAAPADRPLIIAQVIDRELAARLTFLEPADREILRLVVSAFMAGIEVKEPDMDEEKAASVAAAFLDGLLFTIDVIVGRPPEPGDNPEPAPQPAPSG